MQKIPLITILLLLAVVAGYMKGFRPQDNAPLRQKITVLEGEIRELNRKIKQNQGVAKLIPADKWDAYYKLNRLGYKIGKIADSKIYYKPSQGRNALEILMEVMQCKSLFGNACILEGLKPLEISVYIG